MQSQLISITICKYKEAIIITRHCIYSHVRTGYLNRQSEHLGGNLTYQHTESVSLAVLFLMEAQPNGGQIPCLES